MTSDLVVFCKVLVPEVSIVDTHLEENHLILRVISEEGQHRGQGGGSSHPTGVQKSMKWVGGMECRDWMAS